MTSEHVCRDILRVTLRFEFFSLCTHYQPHVKRKLGLGVEETVDWAYVCSMLWDTDSWNSFE